MYLLLAAIAMGVAAFLPFLTTEAAVNQSQLLGDAVFNADDHGVLSTLIGIVSGITLVAIFAFSNRKRQLLIALIALVAVLGTIGFGAYLWIGDQSNISEAVVQPGIGMFTPVAAIVFLLLARRAISKDEKLVSSADRLR